MAATKGGGKGAGQWHGTHNGSHLSPLTAKVSGQHTHNGQMTWLREQG